MQVIKKIGSRYIDYRMAWLGAAFMGLVVLLVNLAHGVSPALVAAGKQATYTFFFAGFIMKTCENLAVMKYSRKFSLFLSFIVPSSMSVGFTYLVHSLKGTPEPLLSTVPTMVLALPTFIWWGRKKRSERDEGEKSRRDAEAGFY